MDWLFGVWTDHPALDLVVALALAGGHAVVADIFHHGDVLDWVGTAQRREFYRAFAGITGIIVGFALASVSFFWAVDSGPRLAAARSKAAGRVRVVWVSTLWMLIVVTFVVLMATVADSGGLDAHAVRWVVEGAFVIAFMRVARLTWLFSTILGVVAADDEGSPAGPKTIGVRGPKRSSRSGHPPAT